MIISTISFLFPFLWTLIVVAYWRLKMKDPINHWLVCALVGTVSFFFFAYTFVLFIILVILKSGIFFKDKKEDGEPK